MTIQQPPPPVNIVMMAATDLEALATECRSSAFRQSLAGSDVWLRVERTLDATVDTLKRSFVVTTNSSSSSSAQPYTSTLGGSATVATNTDDDDDDGLGYTIRVNRNAALSGLDAGEFAPTSVDVRDAVEVARLVATATSAFRFLRNACAACSANQSACSDTNAIALAHAVVLGCCEWIDVDDDTIKSAVVLLAQVALQFLVNCVTGHTRNQATTWTLFFPDHFQRVLVECHEHRKIVAFTVALILNCINGATSAGDEPSDAAARRIDLVCARNLMITVLQRCLVKPSATSALTADATNDAIDERDPAFEWISVLFGVLFDAHLAKNVYNAVGAHMLSALWSRVTPEQLICLRMLTHWVTTRAGTDASRQSPPSATASQAVTVLTSGANGAAITSLALFEFLVATWVYVITEGDDDRPDEADDERKRVWIALENDAKLLLLDALGVVTQCAPLVASPAGETLLLSLLDELHRVWTQRRLGVRLAQTTNAPVTTVSTDAHEPFGYRSGMIRAIGNLSFRHTAHQDAVRTRGRLELFLNHCNIDDANPFVREWSLVALRNLCEGNEANQQYINALKPQSMGAPAPGTHVDADADTAPAPESAEKASAINEQ